MRTSHLESFHCFDDGRLTARPMVVESRSQLAQDARQVLASTSGCFGL